MSFFHAVVSFVATYRYPFAFFSVVVEGPIAMVGSGMLYRLGQFDFLPLYIALVSGDLVADMFWYSVGRYAAEPFIRRFGRFFGVTKDVFEKMEEVFRKHDTKILFISKLTMGFGFALATLVAAGAVRVPFKKYFILNLFGGFIWTGFLIFVGFFFGQLYSQIADSFKVAFLGVVALIAVVLFSAFISIVRGKYGNSRL